MKTEPSVTYCLPPAMYCIYTGTPWGMGAKYEPWVSTQTPSISLTSGDESAQRATSEADTRGLSWYKGLVLPPSRIRGPGIDITTFAKYAQKFQSKSIFLSKVTKSAKKMSRPFQNFNHVNNFHTKSSDWHWNCDVFSNTSQLNCDVLENTSQFFTIAKSSNAKSVVFGWPKGPSEY